MRAYSCIDTHGRWTEIPTQVQFSTSHDGHPPQPSPTSPNVGSNVIDINADEESEEDKENALQERVTALRARSKSMSRSHTTVCAASPAQVANVSDSDDDPEEPEGDPEHDPDDDSDPNNKLEDDRLEETTACAAPPAQSAVPLSSNHRGRTVTATACADSPAQALPRDVVRGQNPNDRSLSDRTDCAALPQSSMGSPVQPSTRPAQPAAPAKPRPDADGLIWHPHPGYPNQEMSEPDAQGRIRYKIHMTTAASQLPSRETDAQRAAELIYRSAIKKYGNP